MLEEKSGANRTKDLMKSNSAVKIKTLKLKPVKNDSSTNLKQEKRNLAYPEPTISKVQTKRN